MASTLTTVLTGATAGIGLAAARMLAPRGGRLIVHGPCPADRVDALLAELRALPGAESVEYVPADFTGLREVNGLVDRITQLTERVDLLINNAACAGPPRREVTGDGHELTLQVNYLAPALLTERLRRTLALRRIVNVGSATHYSAELDFDDLECERHQWDGADAYARSKLALTTYTCALGARDLDAVSVHPGIVETDLLHAMFPISGASPESAAANILEVAGRRGDAGSYYDEQRPVAPHPAATDAATQRRLAEMTGEWLRPFLR